MMRSKAKAVQARIASVTPLRPYVLEIHWVDDTTSEVDLEAHFRKFKVFRPLVEQPELFQGVTVGEWGWDVSWGGDMDVSVTMLYGWR